MIVTVHANCMKTLCSPIPEKRAAWDLIKKICAAAALCFTFLAIAIQSLFSKSPPNLYPFSMTPIFPSRTLQDRISTTTNFTILSNEYYDFTLGKQFQSIKAELELKDNHVIYQGYKGSHESKEGRRLWPKAIESIAATIQDCQRINRPLSFPMSVKWTISIEVNGEWISMKPITFTERTYSGV